MDLAGLKGQVIFYGFMLEASNAASLPGLRLKEFAYASTDERDNTVITGSPDHMKVSEI